MIKLLTVVAVLITGIWVLLRPDFDSVSAFVTALASLGAAFAIPAIRARKKSLRQKVQSGGFAIQAGRDVKIELKERQ